MQMYIHKDTHIYVCNMDHVIFITVTGSHKRFTNLYEEVQKVQSYLDNLVVPKQVFL